MRTEVLAGLTTFLTMSYIIFVQPAILSGSLFGFETGMDFGAVTTATCLAAALATAIMGLYANYPVAQAPGMGQNFFFVFSLIPAAAAAGHADSWQVALGIVLVAGILFLLLSLLGVRRKLLEALSPSMQAALAGGIGMFIAFVGLRNAGLVIPDPGTAVTLNPAVDSPDRVVFFVGLLLTAVLQARNVRAALLWGMLSGLVVTLTLRGASPLLPGAWTSSPAFAESLLVTAFEPARGLVAAPPSLGPTIGQANLAAALSMSLLPLVLLVLFMDLFDTMGTLVAVGHRAGLIRDGRLERAERAMLSDAAGTVAGAWLGTSTVTSYIESAAGVEQGGRTGLAALTTAALFLAALFFSPIVAMVGSYPPITAPALVIVGALMMESVRRVEWDDASEAIPAFLTLVGIPLTYSIADGLAIGLIAYPIVKLASGRGGELSWLMKGLAVVLLMYFVFLRAGMA